MTAVVLGAAGCSVPSEQPYKEREFTVVVPAGTPKASKPQTGAAQFYEEDVGGEASAPARPASAVAIEKRWNQVKTKLTAAKLSDDQRTMYENRLKPISRLIEEEKYAIADDVLAEIQFELKELAK